MSRTSAQKPAAVFGEVRSAADVNAMIDHGGEVKAVDENGVVVLHPADVSEEIGNAGDVDDGRSAVELHHESYVKYVESDNEATIVESGGSETRENSEIPKENKDLHQNNENHDCLITKADDDEQEDILNVCEKDKEQGLSQLHLAAELGDMEAVRSLLMSSVNVDVLDTKHNTPLHYATLNSHVDVVNLLLNKKAYVNSRNALGQTSLHLASEIGHLAIAQILLHSNADVNAVCRMRETPLHLAVEREHVEIVRKLIFNGANINACNNAKMTPLHLACQYGHTAIVEILLDNHATVNVMKQSEKTPFYLAAKNGHADTVDLLLHRGVCDFAEIPFENKGKDIQTPLQVAVEEGHTEVVEVILKHSSMNFEKLTKDGGKLQENIKRGVMPVELLKSDGRRVSAEIVWTERNTPLEIKRNLEGDVPLVRAALSIDPNMVQLVLNVDLCMYSEKEIADSFRSVISQIRPKCFTDESLSDTIKNRKSFTELAKFLINSSKFNVNHQDSELDTFLHDVIRQRGKSSSYGCLTEESNRLKLQIQIINDVMQLLLEKGADFNLKNSFGVTPLIIASVNGCDQVIRTLFNWEHKSGIKLDLDARDRYGETALIKAARGNHVSIVRLLLNHKASVNLHDYYGFTALHAAVYAPNRNWFDLHFFCKGLLQRNFDGVDFSENNSSDKVTWRKKNVDPCTVIDRLQSYLKYNTQATRFREEIVKLLLDTDETNVNAIDFRGNTPRDLAVKSSKRINSATFEALENRGAIRNLKEPEDEAPIEVARVDERGRNPLHRLVLSEISNFVIMEDMNGTEEELDQQRFDLMVQGILLGPDNFRHVVNATDDKGRIPLHYAAMQQFDCFDEDLDLLRVLLKLGSNVNAADMYGKTPLHYAEWNWNDENQLLVNHGADEDTRDKQGHTLSELEELRHSNLSIAHEARRSIKKEALYAPIDIAQVLSTHYVTELTKQKLFETIRICSQSPRTQNSSEEAIWKIWTKHKPIRLNKRLRHLKPLIHQFIERLAVGIKEKDLRFECQPSSVGSADEGTKVVMSADFDFNFKLIKFSQLCEAFPHPLGPKGYFQLRRKPNEDTKSRQDEKFDSFFNLDKCLLTNEVNSRFKIILKEVLSDHAFWQDDHLFEWNVKDQYKSKYESLRGLCMTIELKMIHPIEDGEGGFLFVDISIDIVACVHVENWWPEDPLPVGMIPTVKADGCTFVFSQPRFDPSKPRGAHFLFSETFARISFAPVESRIIKESSPLIKAAYILCKMILYFKKGTTYQLKTCLLFCMESLDDRNGSRIRYDEKITPKQLNFWVERIMFCFMEFSRHNVYPCYFMPSFKQQKAEIRDDTYHDFDPYIKKTELGITLRYPAVYDIYLDLCPDDTAVDIPIVPINIKRQITEESFNGNHDPQWEQFDREEFIRMLSSHGEVSILIKFTWRS